MATPRLLQRDSLSVAGIVVGFILLIAINAFSSVAFRGATLDLTQGSLYTLSSGTKQVLGHLNEPITLRYFYSQQLGEEAPQYGTYAARVRELLERYVGLSGGKIKLEIYNPVPFSDEEDLAVSYGLQGVPVNQAGEQVYFGVAATNSTDDEGSIAFFHPERERFLEYDLTSMVAKLANPKKKVVGLITALPLQGQFMPQGGMQQPWAIMQQISDRFDVKPIFDNATEIPADIDVLMIVQPKRLSEQVRYAIDQYVLKGGKALVFVDPHSESDVSGPAFGGRPIDTASDMPKLLGAWGVELVPDRVVADAQSAIRISVGDGPNAKVIDYPLWLNLDNSDIDPDDVVTAQLSRITLGNAGELKPKEGSTVKMTPLIQSSPESMLVDANKVRIGPDFVELIASFKSDNKRKVLAARLNGIAKTAFPDGPPKPKEEKKSADADKKPEPAAGKPADKTDGKAEPAKTEEEKKYEAAKAAQVKESKQPINVIVVADADMLSDRFWVSVRDFFGQQMAVKSSDNADFTVNALDNLSGSDQLIGLRSRGQSSRPFTLVQELQSQAELRLRTQEQSLTKKLEDAQKKLADVQTKADSGGKAILTPEQLKTIDEFRAEMLNTRQQLRKVQRALREDIDRLDARLKFVNIGLIPILVALVAIVLGIVWRRRRSRRYGHPG
jgi:gliding motility-associatede transport system auxiliary component